MSPPAGLKRILGIGFGLAVVIGSTLGIGILRTPGLVAAQLETTTAILAIWLLGGVYTLLGAVCCTELGTMLPRAGGYYVYARRAFGDGVGFAVGWTDWLTYCSVLGYVSIAIGEFSVMLVPSLAGGVRGIAIAFLVGFMLLQWTGLRVSSWFQELTTALKFLAFVLLIGLCLSFSGPDIAAAAPAAAPTLTSIIVATQSVVITYGGWQSALYFSEEDRDPPRNLPYSIIGGVALVTLVYLLVNVALLAVVPIGDLSRSTLPAADAAQRILGARGALAITVLSLVSLPPLINAVMMVATRVLFAMGRDGLMWARTAQITPGGTPLVATVVSTAVAIALVATGTFQKLVAVVAFFMAANYCVCCVALIVLRRREPERPRPFRAWGYPWSAAIVLAGSAALVAGTLVGDTGNAIAALGLLAVGMLLRKVKGQRAKGKSEVATSTARL